LQPIAVDEFETRWQAMLSVLQRGDLVFTVDTVSAASRLITYLDQGTWSHVCCYTGSDHIHEAITGGVVERHIDAYHDLRYRLGIYRTDEARDDIDARIGFLRAQVGKPYAFKKVLVLGVRMLLGLPPGEVTPNMMPPMLRIRLVHIV
jgi:uncharacterized protein YycO